MHSTQLRQQVGHTSSQQSLAQLAHAATGSQEQHQFLLQPAVQLVSPRQEVCGFVSPLDLQQWCFAHERACACIVGAPFACSVACGYS